MNVHPPDKKNLRGQLFVMRKVQGQLLLRITAYCCTSTAVTCLMVCGSEGFVEASLEAIYGSEIPRFVVLIGCVLGAILLVLPVALYDAAKLSGRMFAPLVRAQGIIRRLGQEEVSPLVTRDETWTDWIRDFNVMVTRVQRRLGSDPGATQ